MTTSKARVDPTIGRIYSDNVQLLKCADYFAACARTKFGTSSEQQDPACRESQSVELGMSECLPKAPIRKEELVELRVGTVTVCPSPWSPPRRRQTLVNEMSSMAGYWAANATMLCRQSAIGVAEKVLSLYQNAQTVRSRNAVLSSARDITKCGGWRAETRWRAMHDFVLSLLQVS